MPHHLSQVDLLYKRTILGSTRAFIPTGVELDLNLKHQSDLCMNEKKRIYEEKDERKKPSLILKGFPSLQLMEKNRQEGKQMWISSGLVHEHVKYSGPAWRIGEEGEKALNERTRRTNSPFLWKQKNDEDGRRQLRSVKRWERVGGEEGMCHMQEWTNREGE